MTSIATTKLPKSRLEEKLALEIRAFKLPSPVREYRFAAAIVGHEDGMKSRLKESGLKDWKFDFAWPAYKVAVEVEGLHSTARGFGGGRHLSPDGFMDDCRKYAEAQLTGWTVYRIPGPWCKSGEAIRTVIRALKYHGRLQTEEI